MSEEPQKLIRFKPYEDFFITAEEYKDIRAFVIASVLCGDNSLAIRILARSLDDTQGRYNEITKGISQ